MEPKVSLLMQIVCKYYVFAMKKKLTPRLDYGTLSAIGLISALVLYVLFRAIFPHQRGDMFRNGKQELTWQDLSELDYRSGQAPPQLMKLNGSRLRIPGFIVPLEDSQGETNEFLLVPDAQSCIHMPPPPPNQIVYVKMKGGKHVVNRWLPVWMTGTFLSTLRSNATGRLRIAWTVSQMNCGSHRLRRGSFLEVHSL